MPPKGPIGGIEQMNFEIKKLTPELIEDFMSAFDNPGFFSNSDFSFGCYCTWYNWTDELERERNSCDDESRQYFKRNLASRLIKEGRLNGFMAYLGDSVVGWCNAGLKENYERICRESMWWTESNEYEKVLSIVCYVVAPDMQRKGIATKLLKAVCEEANEKGYDYIEAYPGTNEDGTPSYHGNYSMYTKQGFELVQNHSGNTIARKKLQKDKEV